ncbi:MAG: hypothetical protein V4581_02375 [Bacteroidota bacterium]
MTDISQKEFIHPVEYEKASNAYLMAIVSVIAGMPLPVINVLASIGYYMAQRKTIYFVRWHCIQAIIAQAIMIPFNSVAVAWTLAIFFKNNNPGNSLEDIFGYSSLMYYWMYILFVVVFNIVEFFSVVITAGQVRKGKNVRWFLIANITDSLTSKENRDPFRL